MIQIPEYKQTKEFIEERITQYSLQPLQHFTEQTAYQFALHCIDLTTLEGSDTQSRIQQLCEKAKIMETAAVCVYPPFVKQAKTILQHTDIKVASVAGAFPSGQSPLFVKLAEVRYAVEQGADEIDMVISRGKFLEGNLQEVFDETVAIKKECQKAHLKVILETGELIDPEKIFQASYLAMQAGADFIKTSTGKISVNATPDAFIVMLDAINQYYNETGKVIGMKPAGGISDGETAILYLKILENILTDKWLTKANFRIGASKLADKLQLLLK